MPSPWGQQPHPLISLAEAWTILAKEVRPVGVEDVALFDAAGRVLLRAVVTRDDYPPFDKAVMDGFAVRSIDCPAPGAKLTITGLAAAGASTPVALQPGQAVRINTGAPLPTGADAVVRIEDTRTPNDATVEILIAAQPERNITRRGTERRDGDTILTPPLRLGPAQIAAAAAAGASTLSVAQSIHAAILTTGDELVTPGSPRGPGQIFESNGPMLAALVRQFGGVPGGPVIVRDVPAALARAIASALQSPLVIAAGGMSLGTLDLVPRAFQDAGVNWRFHGADLRPGKPVAYGRGPAGQHVFGLPGNPVSVFVCAWLFVRMALRAMQGLPPEPPKPIRATLSVELKPAKDPRPAYVPAIVWNDPQEGLMTKPTAWGGSGDPFGLAMGNALLVRQRPTEELPAGAAVSVIITDTDWP